jgi:hypothetical protein
MVIKNIPSFIAMRKDMVIRSFVFYSPGPRHCHLSPIRF